MGQDFGRCPHRPKSLCKYHYQKLLRGVLHWLVSDRKICTEAEQV